jgi:hypothetical protein
MRITMSTLLLLALVSGSSAQSVTAAGIPDPASQNFQGLVTEMQRTSQNAKTIDLVWWIPVDFWRLTAPSNPNVSSDQIEQFVRVLSPYTLIAAAHGDMGPFGGVTWTSDNTLRSGLVIMDSSGHEYTPMALEQVSADAKNFAAILKPLLTGLLGAVGENLHFFYFPSLTQAGTPVADPRAEGSFAVRVGAQVHRWRLPLGSLLPERVCPVDGERLNGAWKFCPWHGKELVVDR